MQGLSDGYFVLPYTLTNHFATVKQDRLPTSHDAFQQCEAAAHEQTKKLLAIKGKKNAVEFHREVGKLMWEQVGMARSKASCQKAIDEMRALREEFWSSVNIPGTADNLNTALERAFRVADFLEFGELLARDALAREESCGGHFREEYQYPDGEALRNDEEYGNVAAWEYTGFGNVPTRHTENLEFEAVKPSVRSYK